VRVSKTVLKLIDAQLQKAGWGIQYTMSIQMDIEVGADEKQAMRAVYTSIGVGNTANMLQSPVRFRTIVGPTTREPTLNTLLRKMDRPTYNDLLEAIKMTGHDLVMCLSQPDI